MSVRVLPTAARGQAVHVLQAAADAFTNIRGAGHTGEAMYEAYLRTASEQHRMLVSVLSQADLDRLLTTPRYWMLHSIDPTGKARTLAWLLDVELAERIRLLTAAAQDIRDELHRYSDADAIIVPDTNVLLHHQDAIDQIPWPTLAPEGARQVQVVIPMLVIDELDSAKRRSGNSDEGKVPVRTRARQTLRTLEEWFADGRSHYVITSGEHVVRFAVAVDDPDRPRLADPDFEIIDVARAIGDLSGKPTVIATSDTAMRLRARAAGVNAERIEPRPAVE